MNRTIIAVSLLLGISACDPQLDDHDELGVPESIEQPGPTSSLQAPAQPQQADPPEGPVCTAEWVEEDLWWVQELRYLTTCGPFDMSIEDARWEVDAEGNFRLAVRVRSRGYEDYIAIPGNHSLLNVVAVDNPSCSPTWLGTYSDDLPSLDYFETTQMGPTWGPGGGWTLNKFHTENPTLRIEVTPPEETVDCNPTDNVLYVQSCELDIVEI